MLKSIEPSTESYGTPQVRGILDNKEPEAFLEKCEIIEMTETSQVQCQMKDDEG